MKLIDLTVMTWSVLVTFSVCFSKVSVFYLKRLLFLVSKTLPDKPRFRDYSFIEIKKKNTFRVICRLNFLFKFLIISRFDLAKHI